MSRGTAIAPSTSDLAASVRRNTRLLTGAQVALWVAVGAGAAFGPITTFELTGRRSAAAAFFAIYSLAQAAGARAGGAVMDRKGRRPGLLIGYLVLAIGGGVASTGAASGSVLWLDVGAALIGAGAGAALLGRGAVADMYPPERRGRAVGLLLVAGTIGAVGGAPLAGAVHAWADGTGGVEPLAVPWLLLPVAAAVSFSLVLALRPDPRDLAVGGGPTAEAARPLRGVLVLRPALAAIVTIGIVQAVMVTFMAVIPVVLHSHDAGEVTVSAVVGLHLGGMFALSPLVGLVLDRRGRRTGLLLGITITALGVALSLIQVEVLGDASGLFLVGVGWSAAYLGTTATLSDVSRPSERGRVLGTADLVASLSAAAGVLAGGFLFEATGYEALAAAAFVALLAPLAVVLVLRETAPGRWAPAEG
jgi:MFS family permease